MLGDQCAQNSDCTINVQNSECSGSTCQCSAGFSPNICGQCVPGEYEKKFTIYSTVCQKFLSLFVGQPLSGLAALGIPIYTQLNQNGNSLITGKRKRT